MVIDDRVGAAELDRLAETLVPPCQLGDFVLEGLVARTATALIYIARGATTGSPEVVLKLTGPVYAPIAVRELHLLNACATASLRGVVRPLSPELMWLEQPGASPDRIAAIELPFLSGGDLVQWIGAHATRTGQLGSAPALAVGEVVGEILRDMLRLPHPIVHGDVKPQNVLLPTVDASIAELTLIDLDASEELDVAPVDLGLASPETARSMAADVNAFGELLFMLATGQEPPVEERARPDPETANPVFNALVVKAITADTDTPGYACMADPGLWRDFAQAQAFGRDRQRRTATVSRTLLSRPVLAVLGIALLCLLILAVATKLSIAV